MCGIAGISARGTSVTADALKAMEKAMAHRGPDGSGQYIASQSQVGLVHTRLSIIDLKTGDQPFGLDDDALMLVANGEIYNYIELRNELAIDHFKTQSDCEVPLHLYRQRGIDFVKALRGMYAIAIHDREKDQLVLSRDPFGIKPLYYTETDGGFVFASEPKAILASKMVDACINKPSVGELLQLQFTTGADTAFKGIKRVLPGETLIVKNGAIVDRHFLSAVERADAPTTEARALKQLDDVLMGSVDIHQRSDVPYGMFLSGGIDSSALLALMARLNDNPVTTFTAGFSGTSVHDERAHAEMLADRVGADFCNVDFDEDDFWSSLPAIAEAVDDPTADYAVLPTYKLAETARKKGIKVVLSGEGGDELFAGYGRYRRAGRSKLLGGRPMRNSGILDGFDLLRDPITKNNWRAGIAAAEQAGRSKGLKSLQLAQWVDMDGWLPNDLLTKLDRCLMAHGVEGRVPFLDKEVAALAFNLPDKLKVQGKMGKMLLRTWLDTALPEAQPFAPKKGFTVPVGEWIAGKGAMLGPLVAKQQGVQQLFKPGAIETLFASLGKKQGKACWTILFYALWHQAHIVGQKPAGNVFEALN